MKTEGWSISRSTGHAQNVHKEVAIDRSVDHLEEAAVADGVGRPPGRQTEMPEFNEELALCVFAQRSLPGRPQQGAQSTEMRVFGFPNIILGLFLIRVQI